MNVAPNRWVGTTAATTIISVLLLTLVVSCQYDPWARGFLRSGPPESDIVGVYRVDSATLSRRIAVPESQTPLQVSPNAKIVLLANHRVEFFNIPEFIYDKKPEVCLISGGGAWQLDKNDDYEVLNFQIQRENYRPDACGSKFNGQLNLYGTKPPYKLHITIGDPDSGDAIQLEKSGVS